MNQSASSIDHQIKSKTSAVPIKCVVAFLETGISFYSLVNSLTDGHLKPGKSRYLDKLRMGQTADIARKAACWHSAGKDFLER